MIGQTFGRLTVINCDEGYIQKSSGTFIKQALVSCSCGSGRIFATRITELKRGKAKSCGCLTKDVNRELNRKQQGESGFNNMIRVYKRNARLRNIEWNLSDEQAKHISSKDCHYCGCKPKLMFKKSYKNITAEALDHAAYNCNGIDRYMNSMGYDFENCVPCCTSCNKKKGKLDGPVFEMEKDLLNLNDASRKSFRMKMRNMIENLRLEIKQHIGPGVMNGEDTQNSTNTDEPDQGIGTTKRCG
jgi:hypothetical protein